MASVDVNALDENEADLLATARPRLRPLLFGPEPVRILIRRPFFAKVLNGSGSSVDNTPHSEIELMERWWSRGGFDGEGGEARLRQRTLLDLVRLCALQQEAKVALTALDPALLQSIDGLVTDGVLRVAENGNLLRFAHEIFFEWAFAHALSVAGARWIED